MEIFKNLFIEATDSCLQAAAAAAAADGSAALLLLLLLLLYWWWWLRCSFCVFELKTPSLCAAANAALWSACTFRV